MKPGKDQDPAGVRSLLARLDEQGDASTPDDIDHGVVGGEAVADSVMMFPVGPDEVLDRDKMEWTSSRLLQVRVPAWPEDEPYAVVARRLVSRWKYLSARIKGTKTVLVEVPTDARYVTTPGFFGCPSDTGDDGDDHWRVVGIVPDGTHIGIHLARRREPLAGVRDVREQGSHVVAVAFPDGDVLAGFACGVDREDGERRPVLLSGAPPKAPNPTTAAAKALANVLDQMPADVDITVWTPDSLLQAAVLGRHAGGTQYRGVRPAAMQLALRWVRRVVERRPGRVEVRRTSRMGAVMVEITSTALALARTPEVEHLLGDVFSQGRRGPFASSPAPGTPR